MNSNPKITKVSSTSTEQRDLDRLTSLPDSVICHILSFLPTKYAARTSLLSTRWKDLFFSVSRITVDDPWILMPGVTFDGRVVKDEKLNFKEFVNRRLLLSKTNPISEFRLKCKNLPEASLITLWLTTLLFSNPGLEVLEFEETCFSTANKPHPVCPPSEIMVCKTLGVLKLHGRNIYLKFPQSVCFPKLKVLHLLDMFMEFPSGSDSFMFAEGYTVIEELKLERILVGDVAKYKPLPIRIFLSTLKRLTIVDQDSCGIDIDTPHLQHLTINNRHMASHCKEVKLCRCESIVSVDFHQPFVYGDRSLLYVTLLNMVNNVKELRISKGLSECFSADANSLLQFPNLTNLELSANGIILWFLLQRAPALKELVYHIDYLRYTLLPEAEPICLGNSLRKIRITSFVGGEAECAMVRYLMQHAAVLKKMTIVKLVRSWDIKDMTSSALKQLIEQPRRSPTCQIEILETTQLSSDHQAAVNLFGHQLAFF